MSAPTDEARKIANEDRPLGFFAIDMMLAAGCEMFLMAGQPGHGATGRFIGLTKAFDEVRKSLKACENGGPDAHRNSWQALVNLGAEAAMLATRGDGQWAYDPKAVNRT